MSTARDKSEMSRYVTFLAPYEDERIKVARYDHYDGPSGYRVTLADGRVVFDANDWGGWHIAEFHAGAWCDYIVPIAQEAMRNADAALAAEEAKQKADEAARWEPVDDAAMFPESASDEPDPERFYRWIVEIDVNEVWVADGFNLTQRRLKDMIESDISHAYSHETRCRIVHAPSGKSIANAQGYKSEEDMARAENL